MDDKEFYKDLMRFEAKNVDEFIDESMERPDGS